MIFKNIGSLIISVVMYYVFQIIGSFIEFGYFGSGAGIEGYELYVPISMVITQLIITSLIKFKSKLFDDKIVFVLSLIIPVALFIYYYMR